MMPFSSFPAAGATVRVDKATSHLLRGPDWTMNMDICDAVNNDREQAKEVLKAIKKRLQSKNPKVQFLALTLLETMVKNCGDYVHFQVAERAILEEMIKIVGKKTDMQVQDKILLLLDSWQEAFGGASGKYPQYYWAYTELKRSGVFFPPRSTNTPPIFTPPVSRSTLTSIHDQSVYGVLNDPPATHDGISSSYVGNLSVKDLSHIRDVMELLKEMLQAVNPHDRSAINDELIQDLVSQCRSNQKKLMNLISSTGNEKLLGEGLELNDDLQSLLAKHEAIAAGTLQLPAASKSHILQKKPIESPVVSNVSEDEDNFDDDFAQLARRNLKYKEVTGGSTSCNSADPLSPNQSDLIALTESSGTSSSAMSSALVPLDPSPVKIQKDEQDMIDLLSITLSTYPSSPHAPLTAPSFSIQYGSPPPATPSGQWNPVNQEHNNYIAPWAQQALPLPLQSQTQPQPQVSHYSSPSWVAIDGNSGSFSSTADQFHNSHANSPLAVNLPGYASRPLQQYNSFGSRVNGTVAAAEAPHAIPNLKQSGKPTSPKPYVLPNRLFEDLVDFRNSTNGQTTSKRSPLSGTLHRPMINGKR